MRNVALLSAGTACVLALVLGAATFVWGITPRKWVGDLDFKITQLCQADNPGSPACATLELDHTRLASTPIVEVGRISTDTRNLPAGVRAGDLVTCEVHQRDVALDSSGAWTWLDRCRPLVPGELRVTPKS